MGKQPREQGAQQLADSQAQARIPATEHPPGREHFTYHTDPACNPADHLPSRSGSPLNLRPENKLQGRTSSHYSIITKTHACKGQ